MSDKGKEPQVEKKSFDGKTVNILGETYEPGLPDSPGLWRNKMDTREEILKYLKYGERYWSGEEFGSEKRKKPA
jgi:hypothetical protein